MLDRTPPSRSSPLFWIGLFAAFALGVFLRLEQLLPQVLVGDEWHPVHEIIYQTAAHTATSFGSADYSIPLVLLYRLEMQWFGISELTLRLPMIVAGVLTIALFPLALRGRMDDRIVILFAALLSTSPFLISYARIGRPYALTLFGIYLSLWFCERAIQDRNIRWKPATGYATLCGLVVWTHAITGPMLIAPLLAQWWASWRGKGLAWRPLMTWTGLVAFMMSLALVPPLVGDPAALAGKAGIDKITLDTVYGALFMWFGTGSLVLAIVCVVLAAAGWATIWRSISIARWVTLGIMLTVLALLATRPWWVDRPLAFGRYLLPTVPLLLLSVSAGVVRAGDGLRRVLGPQRKGALWTVALAIPFLVTWWMASPLPEILRQPNSYTQDAYFQYDYRKELNLVRIGMHTLPESAFWATLSSQPTGSLKVAVAPFPYATFEWPAPLWERASKQRVVPAFLWGACMQTRAGEVPPDARFNFRNAAHLKDKDSLLAHGVDYLAYYRPEPRSAWSAPIPECEAWVRKHFGPPDYEDRFLIVWHVRKDTIGEPVLRSNDGK